MNLYQNFATNKDGEIDGVWLPVMRDEKTGVETKFLIARAGGNNKAYFRALEAAQKPYRRPIQLGTMDKDKHEDIIRKVFAEHCVKGWENVTDREGAPIPHSTQAVYSLLTELPELYDMLWREANSIELFKQETQEEDAKN